MGAPISTRILVFFAANPTEVLTTEDIAAKFSMPRDRVRVDMKALRKAGWLQCTAELKGRHTIATWSAGSEMLKALGRMQ